MSFSPSQLEAALSLLPHGDAFRFVDSLSVLDPGKHGVGHYRVTGEESFLSGHFPNRPIWPAVIMVEAVAQLGGVVIQSGLDRPLEDMRLTAMRHVKVFGTAEPGESLTVQVSVAGSLGTLFQIEGKVSCGDRELVIAQVTLSGREPSM